jgi:hypothetical protein
MVLWREHNHTTLVHSVNALFSFVGFSWLLIAILLLSPVDGSPEERFRATAEAARHFSLFTVWGVGGAVSLIVLYHLAHWLGLV